MRLTYSIEEYNDEIREAYLRLLPHQEQYVARGKLNWKFEDQPAAKGLIAICRSKEHGIVGLNAFMPSQFRAGANKMVLGYQSMDTIVDPVARGNGVFTELIKAFYRCTEGAFVYGFPNLNSSPGFFGKLGWTSLGSVPMLVKPLRTGIVAKRISSAMPDWPMPNLGCKPGNFRYVERFEDDVSEVWSAFADRHAIDLAVERSAQYLNWRMAAHPNQKYSLLSSVDGGGYAATAVSQKHGGNVGYVMEAFGEDSILAGLIKSAADNLRLQGADIIFAWCLPNSPNYAAYKQAGFFALADWMRPIKLNFGMRVIDTNQSTLNRKNWYISYLDSDTI